MKPVGVAVSVFLLVALLQTAISIKCYTCSDNDGNCKSNEKTCPSGYDYCYKLTSDKGGVAKSCNIKLVCDNLQAACDKVPGCKSALCCQGDLCNASTNVKSTSMVMVVTMLAALARVFFL